MVDKLVEEETARKLAMFMFDTCGDAEGVVWAGLDARQREKATKAAQAALAIAQKRVNELEEAVIAFAAPWAVEWAKMHELPKGHLHPQHYDLLEQCGARMTDFTRAALPTPEVPGESEEETVAPAHLQR